MPSSSSMTAMVRPARFPQTRTSLPPVSTLPQPQLWPSSHPAPTTGCRQPPECFLAPFPAALPSPFAITTRLLVSILLQYFAPNAHWLHPLPMGIRTGAGCAHVPVSPGCLSVGPGALVGLWGATHLVGGCCSPGRARAPTPQAPCLPQTVASSPYVGGGRGVASLRLLSVLHQNIHPLLGQQWAAAIALLLKCLDGKAPGGGRCLSICGPASASLPQTWPVGTRALSGRRSSFYCGVGKGPHAGWHLVAPGMWTLPWGFLCARGGWDWPLGGSGQGLGLVRVLGQGSRSSLLLPAAMG